MAIKTLIAWTDHTFNGWWGCVKISAGCKNCYATSLASRYGHDVWGVDRARRKFGPKHWLEPLKWDREATLEGRRHRVFCGSMMDWAEDHPDADRERPKIWEAIRATPMLDWQLLTKRPERIAGLLPDDWDAIKARVWIGTSVENADVAWRADHIREIDAAVRFISYEPAIGPIAGVVDLTNIDWLIYGGESGPKFRPEDKQWARDIMAQCRESGTAFFHKQSAAHVTERGIELDGVIVREYPLTA